MVLGRTPAYNPERCLDRFSRFCTAHGGVPSGIAGHALAVKLVSSHGGSGRRYVVVVPLVHATQLPYGYRHLWRCTRFYRAMHFRAKRGFTIAILSVRLSVSYVRAL